MFRSTGSYEPDHSEFIVNMITQTFRSTGSYEPDRLDVYRVPDERSFDPQALTSLTDERYNGRG